MNSIPEARRNVTRLLLLCLTALAAAFLAGCASSTQFNGVWVNPQAGNRFPVNDVLVIGINRDATARRIYEDAVVTQLVTRGIKAQASYRLLPDIGPIPPSEIEAVLRNAGVGAVLVSRTIQVSTDIRVTPGYSHGPLGLHSMWAGAYSVPPNVYTVTNVAVETRVFDVKDFGLLWSGSSTTNPTASMQQTINDFASLLIKELAKSRIIA